MARFEITTIMGEKILVDHPAAGVQEILAELNSNAFLRYTEVRTGTSAPAKELIVASGHIVLVRPLDEFTTQSSTFRPKR